MKPAVLAYVPPPKLLNADVFLANIQKFKIGTELLLYSDHNYPNTIRIGNPDTLKHPTNRFVLNNSLFITALRIARSQQITHVLYVEADSRVGQDHWDEQIFEEYCNASKDLIAGGSCVVYNPCNHSLGATKAWMNFMKSNTWPEYPIPCYGWKSASDATGSAVYTNGSLGVYSMEWMEKIFNLEDPVKTARESLPWDQQIGVTAWKMLGEKAYEKFLHMVTVFSSFGDVLSSEDERMNLLRNGEIVAVHQIKSRVTI